MDEMATPKGSNDAHESQSIWDQASKKRKRNDPSGARRSSSPASKLTPASSFSSSIEDTSISTPPNQLLQNLEESGGSGAASPRTIAAGELSRLSIDESIGGHSSEDGDIKHKGKDSPRGESSPLAIGDDEEVGPPLKRVPRGIRSPRPKFRRFSLPEKKSKLSEEALKPRPGPSIPTNTTSSTPESGIEMDNSSLWDFDFSSMTWQDSEITGHLMQDSDDDGTGINGIGFKPTPSIARQRAAQRRRQVQEWKMRQEMEERERRAERRRIQAGAVIPSGLSNQVEVKKAVRFSV